MQKTNKTLLFLCTFLITFGCIAMETETPTQPKLTSIVRQWFNRVAQNTQNKYNNLCSMANAYKWIREHPVTTITASDIINWTNSHPIATGSIISAVTITSIYGTYRLTKDLIQKLRTKI